MKRVVNILTIIILLIPVTGCVEKNQLEQLGLITAVGFDYSDKKDVIKGTAVLQTFDPQMKNISNIISDEGKTSKGIRENENLKSNNKLVSGQLRVVVFGEEVAKDGTGRLVDTLNRDATIGNMLYISVAKGTAEDLLKKNKIEASQNLGTYLYQLIKQNVEEELVISPTLYEYNHSFYDEGKDPVIPILKLDAGDIVISGAGLFKDDQYIEELKLNKLFFLKVLIDQYKAGALELELPIDELKKFIKDDVSDKEKLILTVDNINSNRKIKLLDKEKPKFSVEVNLETRVLEISENVDLGNPEVVKILKKITEKEIKKEMSNLIAHFQNLGIDPVGFGNFYNSRVRGKNFKQEEWREMLKTAEFDIRINNKIVRTGVID
ncbi:Ger(x)C family spore germination protein [Bacillus sp. 31A1R]|uniref:Ger(X)C family spore germination protein n=1 Tax=Robertmurraya mangrovi TaxID=3098077 RepID=A0ABU5J131_9BACI|nr:Ger(x)C family spore germination protein [Bacillus sp. 31A1R]MDZ5473119.1 Ger(x)C family spore germination protein [Bacillus sp. 31A1R]